MALSVERELSVLIVESEAELGDLVDLHLRQAGFRTRRARSGGKAVAASVADPPDALVLDVELPDVGGLDVCRMLRAQPATEEMPILLLSGRSSETDRIAGLEAGADEYLVKPVSVRELVLRIGRLHKRRGGSVPGNGTVRAGPFRIDTDGYLAYVDGKAADLTLLEFQLLQFFVEHPGKVHTRQALLEKLWGSADDTARRTIDTHIKRLRQKLGDSGRAIETVRGVGYRLRF